jgi:hypothetical protein
MDAVDNNAKTLAKELPDHYRCFRGELWAGNAGEAVLLLQRSVERQMQLMKLGLALEHSASPRTARARQDQRKKQERTKELAKERQKRKRTAQASKGGSKGAGPGGAGANNVLQKKPRGRPPGSKGK